MKVAWVIRPAAGGIKQHLNYLRRGLSSCCEIIVCGPQELEEWAEGCPFYPIEITDGIEPKQDLKAVWQLTKVLRAVKPELIHIHGLKSVMIAVPAAKLSGVKKTLFTAHNMLPQPQTRWYRATHGLVNRTLLRALIESLRSAIQLAVSWQSLYPTTALSRSATAWITTGLKAIPAEKRWL